MPTKASNLYDALKSNGFQLESKDAADFYNRLKADPAKANDLFNAIKQNKNIVIESKTADEFATNLGLKKKENFSELSEAGSGIQPAGDVNGSTTPSTNAGSTAGTTSVSDDNIFFSPIQVPQMATDHPEINRRLMLTGDVIKKATQDDFDLRTKALSGDIDAINKVRANDKKANDYFQGKIDDETVDQQRKEEYRKILTKRQEEQARFSDNFYSGKLDAADIATLHNKNPLITPDNDVTNFSVAAEAVNNKTNNLRYAADAVRDAGAYNYADKNEKLTDQIKDAKDRIETLAGQNYIHLDKDGKYVTEVADFQFQADEANNLLAEVKAKTQQQDFVQHSFNKFDYQPRKQQVTENILDQIAKSYNAKDITDAFVKLAHENNENDGPLQFDKDGLLDESAYRRLNSIVTDYINKTDDSIIKAGIHGTSAFNRTGLKLPPGTKLPSIFADNSNYYDVTNSVWQYLTTVVPAKINVLNFKQEYKKAEPRIAPLLESEDELNRYFSDAKTKTFESGLKASLDSSYLNVYKKYDAILKATPAAADIIKKWTDKAQSNQITPEIADINIRTELNASEPVRKILDNRQAEMQAARNGANKQRELNLINGIKNISPDLYMMSDGNVGVKGVPEDEMKSILDNYNQGARSVFKASIEGAAKRYGIKADIQNEQIKDYFGSFAGSLMVGLRQGTNSLAESTFRWMSHNTGVGVDAADWFTAKNVADNLSIGEYADQHFKYKGVSSLIDPAYYGFNIGQSAPYAVPGILAGMASGGGATGIILAGLGGGALETVENSINTYNDLYKDGFKDNGVKVTSQEASAAAAENFKGEILPNMMMQAMEFGALLRVAKDVKPVLSFKSVAAGLADVTKGSFIEAAQEGYQGLIQYNAAEHAKGNSGMDLFDYMKTDDFRQNFFGGLAGGLGTSSALKPFTFVKSVDNWKQMVASGNRELINNAQYSSALGHEASGNGASFRDGLRLRIANEQYKDESEKQDLGRTLAYSIRLSDAIQRENIAPSNITGLYAAHNMAMSDLYTGLSKADEGASTLSKTYAEKAKEHMNLATGALDGNQQVYFMRDNRDNPIFISKESANVLEQQGNMKKWLDDGVVNDVAAINDREFTSRMQALKEAPPAEDKKATAAKQYIQSEIDGWNAIANKSGMKGPVADIAAGNIKKIQDNPIEYLKNRYKTIVSKPEEQFNGLKDIPELKRIDAAINYFIDEKNKGLKNADQLTVDEQSARTELLKVKSKQEGLNKFLFDALDNPSIPMQREAIRTIATQAYSNDTMREAVGDDAYQSLLPVFHKEEELRQSQVQPTHVNMKIIADRIPRYNELHEQYKQAMEAGDENLAASVRSEFRNDLSERIKQLLPDAPITIQDVHGAWDGGFDKSFTIKINGALTPDIEHALSKIAQDFDRDAIHFLRPVNEDQVTRQFGVEEYEGSGVFTQTVEAALDEPMTAQQFQQLLTDNNIQGQLSANGQLIKIYNSYEDVNKENIESVAASTAGFAESTGRFLEEIKSRGNATIRQGVAELRSYGKQGHAIAGYERVAGDDALSRVYLSQDYKKRLYNEAGKSSSWARRILNNGQKYLVELLEGMQIKKSDRAMQQTKIAKDYDRMQHNALDIPIVKQAYNALAKLINIQYAQLPVRIYAWSDPVFVNGQIEWRPKTTEPYTGSRGVINDIHNNNQMVFFTTAAGFGSEGVNYEGHPMLAPTKFYGNPQQVVDEQGNKVFNTDGSPRMAQYHLNVNDAFRVVHDYMAHATVGATFGAEGEEKAWMTHAATILKEDGLTDKEKLLAMWALTSETRGQNSWVNFSGINDDTNSIYEEARRLRKEGKNADADRVHATAQPIVFADQKADLLPISDMYGGVQEVDNFIRRQIVKDDLEKYTEEMPSEIDEPAERGMVNDKYKKVEGGEVDGLKVRDEVPNTGSITASFTDYTVLPGIREIPMSEFEDSKPRPTERIQALADQIKESGEINPLIVAIDAEGPYILEGAHRFDALKLLDKQSLPALVVIDHGNDFIEQKEQDALGDAADAQAKGKVIEGSDESAVDEDFKNTVKDKLNSFAEDIKNKKFPNALAVAEAVLPQEIALKYKELYEMAARNGIHVNIESGILPPGVSATWGHGMVNLDPIISKLHSDNWDEFADTFNHEIIHGLISRGIRDDFGLHSELGEVMKAVQDNFDKASEEVQHTIAYIMDGSKQTPMVKDIRNATDEELETEKFRKTKDFEELITYAFTNKAFAEFLDSLPATKTVDGDKSKTIFGQLKDIIRTYIQKLFAGATALDQINGIVDKYFDTTFNEDNYTKRNEQYGWGEKMKMNAASEFFRGLKIKGKNNTYVDFTFGLGKPVWNFLMESIARSIDAGVAVYDAITNAITDARKKYDIPLSDEELRNRLEKMSESINDKPRRETGEPKGDYVRRVLEWRTRMLASVNPENAARALSQSQEEMTWAKNVQSGSAILSVTPDMTNADFNKQLSLPVTDTDVYVASLKNVAKTSTDAFKTLQKLRGESPKVIMMSEIRLLRKQMEDFERGYVTGGKDAKEANKEFRAEIDKMLEDYNEAGVFNGIKYSSKELLSLAKAVNRAISPKSLTRLNNLMQHMMDTADYGRSVARSAGLRAEVKGLLKKDYITQNDIDLIKEVLKLNPLDVTNVTKLNEVLSDIHDSRSMKTTPVRQMNNTAVREYIRDEQGSMLDAMGTDVIQSLAQLLNNSDNYRAAVQEGRTTSVNPSWAMNEVKNILYDTSMSFDEKKAALDTISQAINTYKDGLAKGGTAYLDQVFQRVLNPASDTDGGSETESIRLQLETVNKSQQEYIDTLPEDSLTPDQKDSLKYLRDVNITGMDSGTLRLFSNVLNNVMDNDDHSGVGFFKAKYLGQHNPKALLEYLKDTGKQLIDKTFKKKLGKLRENTMSMSSLMTRLTNNNVEISTLLDNGVSLHDMKVGFVKSENEYHNNITKPLAEIFTKYPTLHKDANALVRLSLYSYLNQSVAGSTEVEMNNQLQRRIDIIRRDIQIKETKGTEHTRNEATREKEMMSQFRTEIMDKTGIDIYDEAQLQNLTKADFDKIQFLGEGEQAVYDLYRDYNQKLQPEHRRISEYFLNKKYEAWDNYMKDSYRHLNSGTIDVSLGDDAALGFISALRDVTAASGAMETRIKGDPLAEKDQKPGDVQRVLSLHFFNSQNQAVKETLQDIHTLEHRLAADEAFTNKQLAEALGADNHVMLKKNVTNFVRNSMGLGAYDKEWKEIRGAINTINKIGTTRQLLSLTAYIKQMTDTVAKTPFNLGKDWQMFFQAFGLHHNEDAQALINKNPISHRKELVAGLNILQADAVSSLENIVDEDDKKNLIKAAYGSAITLFDRFFNHVSKAGVQKEAFIAKPIKAGDYTPAKYAWLAYYGQWLVTHGKYDKFSEIDWKAENESMDKSAAAYAEQQTSKKLNENLKSTRSNLVNSSGIGNVLMKSILFPFGSFNMHNWNVMLEDMRTIFSNKNVLGNQDTNVERLTAAKSLMASIIGESIFQGTKIGISLYLIYPAAHALLSLFAATSGDAPEDKQLMSMLEAELDKAEGSAEDSAFQRWYTETIGNLFFGGFGNVPQKGMEKLINTATDSDFFYAKDLTYNQQLKNADNYGMQGAAFSGLWDLTKTFYRVMAGPDNRFGEHVHITGTERQIVAATMLSEILTMSGNNPGGADLNRIFERINDMMNRELSKKYKDPDIRDMTEFFNKPTTFEKSVGGQTITFSLTPEQQQYYVDQHAIRMNMLQSAKIDEKEKKKMAGQFAKAMTWARFPEIIQQAKKK